MHNIYSIIQKTYDNRNPGEILDYNKLNEYQYDLNVFKGSYLEMVALLPTMDELDTNEFL